MVELECLDGDGKELCQLCSLSQFEGLSSELFGVGPYSFSILVDVMRQLIN